MTSQFCHYINATQKVHGPCDITTLKFLWSVRLPNSIPWLAMGGVYRPLNKPRCLAAFSGLTLYSATFSMRMTIFHFNCASNLVRCNVQVLMTCGLRTMTNWQTSWLFVCLLARSLLANTNTNSNFLLFVENKSLLFSKNLKRFILFSRRYEYPVALWILKSHFHFKIQGIECHRLKLDSLALKVARNGKRDTHFHPLCAS